MIELVWKVEPGLIPQWYYYLLYSGLTTSIPTLKTNTKWAISRISNAAYFKKGVLRVGGDSYLKIRCPLEYLDWLKLPSVDIKVGSHETRLELSSIAQITYKESLSGYVCIKNDCNKEPDLFKFAVSLGKQLRDLQVDTIPVCGDHETWVIKKEPCRVYPLFFAGLRPGESIALQSVGIGGRQHFGCGFFE